MSPSRNASTPGMSSIGQPVCLPTVRGMGPEVVAVGFRQRGWANMRVPWLDRYRAMASAWQMSGSVPVPVNHQAVKAGQEAEDLVSMAVR
jgi:hypothetical protein